MSNSRRQFPHCMPFCRLGLLRLSGKMVSQTPLQTPTQKPLSLAGVESKNRRSRRRSKRCVKWDWRMEKRKETLSFFSPTPPAFCVLIDKKGGGGLYFGFLLPFVVYMASTTSRVLLPCCNSGRERQESTSHTRLRLKQSRKVALKKTAPPLPYRLPCLYPSHAHTVWTECRRRMVMWIRRKRNWTY